MPTLHGPLSLGELIQALKEIAQRPAPTYVRSGRGVYIDWNCMVPRGFSSYRGSYDHLAICFETEHAGPSLADFLRDLEGQVGAIHEGWKGGQYTMREDTPVWVANPGTSNGWGVSAVWDEGYAAVLKTKNFEF